MGHYAKILNGIVTNVIVAEPEFFDTFVDSSPGRWIQTSYNTRGGVHMEGGTPLRKNFGSVGSFYDEEKDVFIPPKPLPSAILNEETYMWEYSIPMPDDGNNYIWNESTLSWDLVE